MSILRTELIEQFRKNPEFVAKFEEAKKSKVAFAKHFLRVKIGMGWSPFIPRAFQTEFMESTALYVYIWVHRRGGKAQPLSSRVLTPNGFKKMGDMEIGDVVITPNNQRATVTQLHPQGVVDIYKVFLEGLIDLECTADHLWKVRINDKSQVLETEKLQKLIESGAAVYIDNCSPLDLGRNRSTNEPYPMDISVELTKTTREIPLDTLYGSLQSRVSYLQGFVKNGTFDKVNRCFIVGTQFNSLVNHIQLLVNSLGGTVRVKPLNKVFSVEIYLPCSLSNYFTDEFVKTWEPSFKRDLRKKILNIEFKKKESAQCITLDSFEHLYLTDYYVVTHNCVDGSTRIISQETGRPTPIREMEGTTGTYTFDFQKNRMVKTECEWVYSGVKSCVKLIFDNGQDIIVSLDHPLYSRSDGWIYANSLGVGDQVLAPSELETGFEKECTPEELQKYLEFTFEYLRIPNEVFQLSNGSLNTYVQQLFLKIGRYNDKIKIVEFRIPKSISLDLSHLLLRLGIWGVIDPTGELSISDPTSIDTFLYLAGFRDGVLDAHSPRRWLSVLKTQQIGLREVYDLCVEHRDHNFLANDLIVHNSYGLVALALWHLIFEPGTVLQFFCQSQGNMDAFFAELDNFIEGSPFVQAFIDHDGTQTKDPQTRTFMFGSVIIGHIIGNVVQAGKKRGIRQPNVVIVDEAGEIPENGWSTINPMCFPPIPELFEKVKVYVAGTVKNPEGEFYQKVAVRKPSKRAAIIKCGIWENMSLSAAQKKAIFEEEGWNMDRWRTEFELNIRATGSSDAFFRPHIDKAFATEYAYGAHNMEAECVNIVTADWDKVQAGSNVVVWSFNPKTKLLKALDTYESEANSTFGFHNACEKLVELFQEYQCQFIAVDSTSLTANSEIILKYGMERGLNLLDYMVPITLQSNVDYVDFQTEEVKKKKVKAFLYQLARLKFENEEIMLNGTDTKMADQFYKYKIISESETNIKFSKKDEHMIDCMFFALKVTWEFLGDTLSEISTYVEYEDSTPVVVNSESFGGSLKETYENPFLNSYTNEFDQYLPDF